MVEALRMFTDFIIYGLIGAAASWFFYSYRRRDLLGGFWGGLVIGTIGGVIVSLVASSFDQLFLRLVSFLMYPKINNKFYFTVNIIAASIGALLFVYILNRINHDRARRP